MNTPMTDERLDELVAIVKCKDWDALNEEWMNARPPFGFLGLAPGCPSTVRHGVNVDTGRIIAALPDKDLDALRDDALIVNMGMVSSSESVQAALQANPKPIFRRYEHYQRLVQKTEGETE